MGPQCSFCGTTDGTHQIEGLFAVLICADCQAVRSRSNRALPTTRVEMADPDLPSELLAHHDPGEPWLKWRCPIPDRRPPGDPPWDLELHTAAEHAGWTAIWQGRPQALIENYRSAAYRMLRSQTYRR